MNYRKIVLLLFVFLISFYSVWGTLTLSRLELIAVDPIVTNLGVSTGQTRVALANSKGQSFSLSSEATVLGFVFEVAAAHNAGEITLEVYSATNGLPDLSNLRFSDTGTLPVGLSANDYLEITLPSDLILAAGAYVVTLSGLGATDIQFKLNSSSYLNGAGSRNNSAAGWRALNNPDSDLIVAVLGSMSPPEPELPVEGPNLIFILTDDLGWTDIQAGPTGPNVVGGVNHGSTYYETPNLMRLAEEGLSFTHCFVQPNCSPTRAAILSGQYSGRSGNGVYIVNNLNRGAGTPTYRAPSQRSDVPAEHTIIAEALKASGYMTAHAGKYHVGDQDGGSATLPQNQGYDYNFGGQRDGGPGQYHADASGIFSGSISATLDPYGAPYTDTYISEILNPVANGNDPSVLEGGVKHVEDALGDAALFFMETVRTASVRKPFYLQLHNYAVHTPIANVHARDDLLTKYQGISSTDSRHDRDNYAAILEGFDQTIGRILDYLYDPNGDGDSEDSIAEETLIMFTSDNGGHIGSTDNDPLRHRKGSFYNGGIRVPLIVWQPGTVPAGQQTDALVHAVDFYPTMIEHAERSMPSGIVFDGESFASHMVDPVNVSRERSPIFYHFPGYLDKRARPCSIAIKRVDGRDYKLIYTYDTVYTGNPSSAEDIAEGLDVLNDPWELYAFNEDLGETEDLLEGSYSNQLLYQSIADEMAQDIYDWLNQTTDGWQPLQVFDRSTDEPLMFLPSNTSDITITPAAPFYIDQYHLDESTNEVTLGWPSELGFSYDIQGASDLDEDEWETIVADIVAQGAYTTDSFVDLLAGTALSRFYRIVLKD